MSVLFEVTPAMAGVTSFLCVFCGLNETLIVVIQA